MIGKGGLQIPFKTRTGNEQIFLLYEKGRSVLFCGIETAVFRRPPVLHTHTVEYPIKIKNSERALALRSVCREEHGLPDDNGRQVLRPSHENEMKLLYRSSSYQNPTTIFFFLLFYIFITLAYIPGHTLLFLLRGEYLLGELDYFEISKEINSILVTL